MTNKSNHSVEVLAQLMDTIIERGQENDQLSYTAKLLAGGKEQCAKKFGEEAFEVALASVGSDKKHIISEAGDVLYHLLVLLRASDIDLNDVMSELAGRTRQSGLQEKASRTKS